jgi:hypothetical protein
MPLIHLIVKFYEIDIAVCCLYFLIVYCRNTPKNKYSVDEYGNLVDQTDLPVYDDTTHC